MARSDRRAPAVDGDDGSRDVACSWRRKESHDLGDFLGRRRTLHRRRASKILDEVSDRELAERVYRPGSDQIHAHPAAAELCGPCSGHRRERRLGCSVGRTSGEAELTGHAADADDAPPTSRCHARGKSSDEDERRSNVLANKASNWSTSICAVGPKRARPALLTKMSTAPTSSASRRTSAASARSAAMNRALPPAERISWTTSAPRRASRPCTITSAPSRASCTAIARPIPDVAPVTSALSLSRSRARRVVI